MGKAKKYTVFYYIDKEEYIKSELEHRKIGEGDIKMKELISIIVPVYNAEEFLSRCINSIIEQSYKNLEIILINDGSIDKSQEICDEYAKKDKRIRVVHQKNKGVCKSRKVGIELATGEYIGFVDSDDWVEVEMYEYMLDKILEYKVDIVTCCKVLEYSKDCKNNQEDYTVQLQAPVHIKEGIYTRYEKEGRCSYKQVYSAETVPMITGSVSDKLFRKEVLNKYYLDIPDNISMGEDFSCVAAAIPFIESIYISDKVFYHYNRYNWNSITRNVQETTIISIVTLYNRLKKIYGGHEDTEYLINGLNRYLVKYILASIPGIINYHFPILDIQGAADVIIYGAGNVGKSYLRQFKKIHSIENIVIIDRNKAQTTVDGVEVVSIKQVNEIHYDCIIVAVLYENIAQDIINELIGRYSIPSHKIIWRKPVEAIDLIM